MNDSVITIGGLLIFITLIQGIFTVYSHFKKPQIRAKEFDLVITEKFKNHEIQQVRELKYRDEIITQLRLDLKHLKDNDLHTITKRLDDNTACLHQLEVQIAKTNTILQERLPKKQ
jgi:hypothetical protein